VDIPVNVVVDQPPKEKLEFINDINKEAQYEKRYQRELKRENEENEYQNWRIKRGCKNPLRITTFLV
jgi:hypothetical protein